MTATVSHIVVFPVKSFDGLACHFSNVCESGALEHDRQFALVDADGRFINAKRTSRIHEVQLLIDPAQRTFEISRRDGDAKISGWLEQDAARLSDWLSDFFSLEVSIVENSDTGFPDDPDATGPTIVSTATLRCVADWFGNMTIDEVRRRFRANIEVDGVEPFWEDRLFGDAGTVTPFRIGDVVFGGTNPCQRCVVPSRDTRTGLLTPPGFTKRFAELREQMLPPWAARQRFDHFYRLSTNTRLIDRGCGVIRVGDPVEIRSE